MPPAKQVAAYSFTKDPTTLTVFLKTMLWILFVVGIISLLSDFAQLGLAQSGTMSVASAESNDFRQRIIGIAYLLTNIVTAIAFLEWIHRANRNARGFGAKEIDKLA